MKKSYVSAFCVLFLRRLSIPWNNEDILLYNFQKLYYFAFYIENLLGIDICISYNTEIMSLFSSKRISNDLNTIYWKDYPFPN